MMVENPANYVDTFRQTIIRLFADALGQDFIIMHDNAHLKSQKKWPGL